jgi:hypothetical protein
MSIKGSCLAATRFWQKILPPGVEIFFQTCLTLWRREEHGNTFALEMGQNSIPGLSIKKMRGSNENGIEEMAGVDQKAASSRQISN